LQINDANTKYILHFTNYVTNVSAVFTCFGGMVTRRSELQADNVAWPTLRLGWSFVLVATALLLDVLTTATFLTVILVKEDQKAAWAKHNKDMAIVVPERQLEYVKEETLVVELDRKHSQKSKKSPKSEKSKKSPKSEKSKKSPKSERSQKSPENQKISIISDDHDRPSVSGSLEQTAQRHTSTHASKTAVENAIYYMTSSMTSPAGSASPVDADFDVHADRNDRSLAPVVL